MKRMGSRLEVNRSIAEDQRYGSLGSNLAHVRAGRGES